LIAECFVRNEFYKHFQFDWTIKKREMFSKKETKEKSTATDVSKIEFLFNCDDKVYSNYPKSILKKFICSVTNYNKYNKNYSKDIDQSKHSFNSKQIFTMNEKEIQEEDESKISENENIPIEINEFDQYKLHEFIIPRNAEHYKKYRYFRINQYYLYFSANIDSLPSFVLPHKQVRTFIKKDNDSKSDNK